MARVSRVASDASKDINNYQRELQKKIDYALRNISVSQILLGLSDNLLVSTNSSGKLISVANLANWIAGTLKQISIGDDGDGTIILSLPQNIDTDADVTFDSITLDDLTPLRLVYTDANKKLVTTSNLTVFIGGTSNRVTVANNGDGTVTITAPQDLHSAANPTFADITGTGFVKGATGKFGNVAGGNYSEFEGDGSYKANGDATVWKDIDFPIIIRTTGAGIPTLATIQGNITAPQWQVNDFNVCEGQEFTHEWMEGSRVYWHVHMLTNGLDINDRYVKWEVEWFWVNVDGQISANDTQSYEYTIPANTPDKTMKLVSIYDFVPNGGHIGGHVYARLKRIASVGIAPTNDPWCTMLQLHIECDTLGSRQVQTK